jgi:glycerate dehydrogenase
MKIVILDGFTVNPGDIKWDAIADLGECSVYDRTPPEETLKRCQGAEVVITSKVVMTREILEKLTGLKYIGVIATGYNVIDLDAAREMGVVVTNIPDYCTLSVAQMVFAHILEFCHHVGHHSRAVQEGHWTTAPDFAYWDFPQIELQDKVLGIIGCGNIGQAVARIALQFAMKVSIFDVCKRDLQGLDITLTDRDSIFSESDIVTLHCPLTPETEGFINKTNLGKMKKSAILINTARGQLVNEADLAQALNEGVIAGAGLDVLSVEPPLATNPLLQARNCFITPHIAWASREARIRLVNKTAENIEAFIAGRPVNVVI